MLLLLPLGPLLMLMQEPYLPVMSVPSTESADRSPHFVPKGWGCGEGVGAGAVHVTEAKNLFMRNSNFQIYSANRNRDWSPEVFLL